MLCVERREGEEGNYSSCTFADNFIFQVSAEGMPEKGLSHILLYFAWKWVYFLLLEGCIMHAYPIK